MGEDGEDSEKDAAEVVAEAAAEAADSKPGVEEAGAAEEASHTAVARARAAAAEVRVVRVQSSTTT